VEVAKSPPSSPTQKKSTRSHTLSENTRKSTGKKAEDIIEMDEEVITHMKRNKKHKSAVETPEKSGKISKIGPKPITKKCNKSILTGTGLGVVTPVIMPPAGTSRSSFTFSKALTVAAVDTALL
jgi:hypothetical protein